MAQDKKELLMDLRRKAFELRDSEDQAKLIEEMLKLLEEIQRDTKNEKGPT